MIWGLLQKIFDQPLKLYNNDNTNGSFYCWLNAPLYAFVAFNNVLNLQPQSKKLLEKHQEQVNVGNKIIITGF